MAISLADARELSGIGATTGPLVEGAVQKTAEMPTSNSSARPKRPLPIFSSNKSRERKRSGTMPRFFLHGHVRCVPTSYAASCDRCCACRRQRRNVATQTPKSRSREALSTMDCKHVLSIAYRQYTASIDVKRSVLFGGNAAWLCAQAVMRTHLLERRSIDLRQREFILAAPLFATTFCTAQQHRTI